MGNMFRLVGAGLSQHCRDALYARKRQNTTRTIHHGAKVKEPDELVIWIRALREWGGLTAGQIAKCCAIAGYTVKLDRVHNICAYTTRSHLVPADE